MCDISSFSNVSLKKSILYILLKDNDEKFGNNFNQSSFLDEHWTGLNLEK